MRNVMPSRAAILRASRNSESEISTVVFFKAIYMGLTVWRPIQFRLKGCETQVPPSVRGDLLCDATRPSALTVWAVEGRPAALHDALDLALATAAEARFALAVIDREVMLEIAELAVGPRIIAQGRAASLDALGQHALVRRCKRFRALAGNGRRQPFLRDARTEQRLADIDVAEPRHDALIQQRRLDRRAFAFQLRRQHSRRERIVERLGPQAFEQLVAFQPLRLGK